MGRPEICSPHTNTHRYILSSVTDTGNCLWHMCLVFCFVFKQHAKSTGIAIASSPSLIIFDPPPPSTAPSPFLPCPVPFHHHSSLSAFTPVLFTLPVPQNLPTTHTYTGTNSAESRWLLLQPVWRSVCLLCLVIFQWVLETLLRFNRRRCLSLLTSPQTLCPCLAFFVLVSGMYPRCLDHACFYLYVHKCSSPDFVPHLGFLFPPLWSYLLTMLCCVVCLLVFFSRFQNFYLGFYRRLDFQLNLSLTVLAGLR